MTELLIEYFRVESNEKKRRSQSRSAGREERKRLGDHNTEKKIFDFKLFLQDDFINQKEVINDQFFEKVFDSKFLTINSWSSCIAVKVSALTTACKYLIFKVDH